MTTYIVEYKKAFGAGAMPEEKEFFDKDEASWFEKAMKRSNYITKLLYFIYMYILKIKYSKFWSKIKQTRK